MAFEHVLAHAIYVFGVFDIAGYRRPLTRAISAVAEILVRLVVEGREEMFG